MTVKQAQCLLLYLSYPAGLPDGVVGTKTSGATSDFQSEYGLPATGKLDETTCKMLIAAVAGTAAKVEKPQQGTASGAEQYLREDGYYHIPRGVDVQLSRNLWAREVHCQGKGCCTESVIYKKMVDTFQAIRDDYGDSIEIATADGSGYRCPRHNSEVNGANGSLHLTGAAFDLHCRDKARLLPIVVKHITDGEIGTYGWGIHAGVWSRGFVNRFTGK